MHLNTDSSANVIWDTLLSNGIIICWPELPRKIIFSETVCIWWDGFVFYFDVDVVGILLYPTKQPVDRNINCKKLTFGFIVWYGSVVIQSGPTEKGHICN